MKSRPPYTITVPWRRVCAVLPALALIGGGIALDAQANPVRPAKAPAVARNSTAIVVPDIAVTIPAVPYQNLADAAAATAAALAKGAPALVLPVGTVPGSSTPVTLDRAGIPKRALDGYRKGVALVGPVDPGCDIDWALLAAIGRIESDHGRFGGNQLDAGGVDRPGVIGIALDGTNGTARIMDTDRGAMDGDTIYDRAVGPMQFLPGTWRAVGADGDGDGVKNPQDIADAATSAAIYLCSGHGDLSQPAGLRAAIMRYNASDSYVRTVTAIADAYRHGVTALPASALPASVPNNPRPAGSSAVAVVRPAGAASTQPGSTPASMLRPPTLTPGSQTATATSTAGMPGATATSPAETGPTVGTPTPTTTGTIAVGPTATLPVPSDTCLALPSETATATATATPGPTAPAPTPSCPSTATITPTVLPTAAP